jgi:hypothetical protein
MPAKANSGRSSLSANQTTSFFLVSGFGSGAYLAKLLAGTKAAVLWLEPAAPMRRIQSVRQTLATNQPLSRAMLNQLRDLKYRIVSRPSR